MVEQNKEEEEMGVDDKKNDVRGTEGTEGTGVNEVRSPEVALMSGTELDAIVLDLFVEIPIATPGFGAEIWAESLAVVMASQLIISFLLLFFLDKRAAARRLFSIDTETSFP